MFILHLALKTITVDLALFLAPLGKLAETAIYFGNVFSLFFIFLIDFLDPVAQHLMDRSLPKFQDW